MSIFFILLTVFHYFHVLFEAIAHTPIVLMLLFVVCLSISEISRACPDVPQHSHFLVKCKYCDADFAQLLYKLNKNEKREKGNREIGNRK